MADIGWNPLFISLDVSGFKRDWPERPPRYKRYKIIKFVFNGMVQLCPFSMAKIDGS